MMNTMCVISNDASREGGSEGKGEREIGSITRMRQVEGTTHTDPCIYEKFARLARD